MISYTFFIHSLTNKIYKILPLKEEENKTTQTFLSKYINNVYIETVGALNTFKELNMNNDYLTVINTLAYMKDHKLTVQDCKSEVFKMLNSLNKIENEYKNELGGDTFE